MLFRQHDLVEAQIAQRLHPAQRIFVVVIALQKIVVPVLAFHQLAIAVDDEFLLIGKAEIHDGSFHSDDLGRSAA